MRGYGIAKKLVKWCELFYKRVEAAVVTGHGMMQWFKVEGGLRHAGKCAQPSAVLHLHDGPCK